MADTAANQKVMTDFRSFLEEGIDEAGGILMGAITGLDPKRFATLVG